MRRLQLWMMTLLGCVALAGAAWADDHDAAGDEAAEAAEAAREAEVLVEEAADEVVDEAPADELAVVDDETDEFEYEELPEPGPYDYTGPYVRAGYAFASFDEEDSDIQFDDAHGFLVAMGWRSRAWFAVELSFAAFYGSETDDFLEFDRVAFDEEDGTQSLSSSEFAISTKFYPLGVRELREFSDSPLMSNLPEIVQPFLAIGFGYSLQDVERLDQTRPAFRFAGGLDIIVWEPFAFTIEGGYTLHDHFVLRNAGTHIDGTKWVTVGTTVRF